MSETFILRASSAPIAMACPGALRASVPVDEPHQAAADGTAAHAVLAAMVEFGELDWGSIADVAARYQADPDEVRGLCAAGVKLWSEVRDSFPGPMTEVAMRHEADGLTLTGHADIVSITGTVARDGDWKGGRKDTDYSQQMRAYGTLTLLPNPELTECTMTILWLRDREIENYTMNQADARDWMCEARERIVNWDGVFHPGPHCQYCRRSHECAAANALARRDVAALSDADLVLRAETALAAMEPDEILDLHRQAKAVQSYAKRVDDAIRNHVKVHGDVVAPDGRRLTMKTEPRRKVRPLEAWPVLVAAGFGDAEFGACVKLSITAVEKVAKTKAARGKGAAAIRELRKALSAAEAIKTEEVHKLSLRRAQEAPYGTEARDGISNGRQGNGRN